MAKLPDATELGSPGGFTSGRPVSSFDGSAVAKGMVALGDGLGRFGAELTQEVNANNQMTLAKAKSDFLTAKPTLDSNFDQDQRYTDMPERYGNTITSVRDRIAGTIPDQRTRQRFVIDTNPAIANATAGARNRAQSLEASTELAAANERLEQIRQTALKSTNDAEREQLIRAGADLIAGIQARGFISPLQAQTMRQKWTRDYAAAALSLLDPEQRVDALRGPVPTSLQDVAARIIQVESGGNPAARNPHGGAVGLGQFMPGTWLATIRRHRPDIAQGRTDAELLALRTDPKIGAEMTLRHVEDNAGALQAAGFDPSAGNVYLAHFLGIGGAIRALKANPNTPAIEIVGAEAVRQNASIMQGKTIGSVIAWTQQKMGNAPSANLTKFLSEDTRVQLYRDAQRQQAQVAATNSAARSEQIERQLMDASLGKVSLMPREEIELDSILTEDRRNSLLAAYDRATADVAKTNAAINRFANSDEKWNPFLKEDRDQAERLLQFYGGTYSAVQSIVDRTGILPQSAATQMLGDLKSGNPKQVDAALNRANNLLTVNPNIFAKIEGGDTLRDSGLKFRHLVTNLGFTADAATRRIIEEQTPEYLAKVQAKVRGEDVDEIIKKNLKLNDLQWAFTRDVNGTWDAIKWANDPKTQVSFSPEARQAMFSDYAELFRDNYLQNGDISLSKSLAIDQLRRVWGVSLTTGKPVVMRYAPERAPYFAGIENAADIIANQAIKNIKEMTGKDVERSALMFFPIPTISSAAFRAGEPVPYQLSWSDKTGVIHTLPPGKGFVADSKEPRAEQTMRREQQFIELQGVAEVKRYMPPYRVGITPLPDVVTNWTVKQSNRIRNSVGDFIPDEPPHTLMKKGFRSIQKRLGKNPLPDADEE